MVGGVKRTATASPSGYNLSSEVLVGFSRKAGKFNIEPVAGLEYSFNHQDSFTESGAGAFNLAVSDQDSHRLRGNLSAQVSSAMELRNHMVFTPQAHAGFIYDMLDVAPTVNQTFQGTSSTFSVKAPNPGRAGVQAGAGASLQVDNDLAVFGDYNGTFKEHEENHALMAGVKFAW